MLSSPFFLTTILCHHYIPPPDNINTYHCFLSHYDTNWVSSFLPVKKLTFSGFFFMINIIQFFLNVFFCPTLSYHWIFYWDDFHDCLENRIGLPAISNMLNWRTVGALRQPPDTLWKEVGAMITYSELFQFVMMLCAVITLVIYFHAKSSAPARLK